MKNWKLAMLDAASTGKIASTATAVAAASCGMVESGQALAPINSISHILYGDEAAAQDGFSLKYTMAGLVLNDNANMTWAALFELLFGDAAARKDVPMALLGGGVVSAIAYVTDYYLVPKRFTPGFEKRLSNRSLLIVYIVLALSLGLGALLRNRRETS